MSYNESLRADSNYPPMSQSDWDRAPWNEVEQPPKDIEVTISLTISKTIKVSVEDYIFDEEGNIDFSECDLKEAVKEQCNLSTINVDEWNIDDFEVCE